MDSRSDRAIQRLLRWRKALLDGIAAAESECGGGGRNVTVVAAPRHHAISDEATGMMALEQAAAGAECQPSPPPLHPNITLAMSYVAIDGEPTLEDVQRAYICSELDQSCDAAEGKAVPNAAGQQLLQWCNPSYNSPAAHAARLCLALLLCSGGGGMGSDRDRAKLLVQRTGSQRWCIRAAKREQHHVAQWLLGKCFATGVADRFARGDENDAKQWYQSAAKQQDAAAQFELGCCCDSEGGSGEMDAKEALTWYFLAAAKGHAGAEFRLAQCYARDGTSAPNMRKAVEWYTRAAKQGHAEAQYSLGGCFERGRGVAKNVEQAIAWYRWAAKQGHAAAQRRLWQLFSSRQRHGASNVQDAVAGERRAEALSWFLQSVVLPQAKQGDAKCQYLMGLCWELGKGVEPNAARAAEWYERAAKQGYGAILQAAAAGRRSDSESKAFKLLDEVTNAAQLEGAAAAPWREQAEAAPPPERQAVDSEAAALCELALYDAAGAEAAAADAARAMELLSVAAEHGNAAAQAKLGLMYELRACSAVDVAAADAAVHAALWYCRAKQQDHAAAQLIVGFYCALARSSLAERDRATLAREAGEPELCAMGIELAAQATAAVSRVALRHQQAAAFTAVHPDVEYCLGLCFQHGWGVRASAKEAAACFRRAAALGHAAAQFDLGCCSFVGYEKDADTVQSVCAWRQAAEQGHAAAEFCLGWCYEHGIGEEADAVQAASWYRLAAEQGHAGAEYALGGCCEHGKGTPTDAGVAAAWYQRAAEQGDADAQFNLGSLFEQGKGVGQDAAQAVAWYRRAAAQSHPEALIALAYCLEHGIGVAADVEEAVAWWYGAAEQGSPVAQAKMGQCFELGAGVEADAVHAAVWYHRAKEQHHPAACFIVGFYSTLAKSSLAAAAEADEVELCALGLEQTAGAAAGVLADGVMALYEQAAAAHPSERAVAEYSLSLVFKHRSECHRAEAGDVAVATAAAAANESWFRQAVAVGRAAGQAALDLWRGNRHDDDDAVADPARQLARRWSQRSLCDSEARHAARAATSFVEREWDDLGDDVTVASTGSESDLEVHRPSSVFSIRSSLRALPVPPASRSGHGVSEDDETEAASPSLSLRTALQGHTRQDVVRRVPLCRCRGGGGEARCLLGRCMP